MTIPSSQCRCTRCYSPISNPVCMTCHLKEVRFFLEDKGVSKSLKFKILADIAYYLKCEPLHQDTCILCGTEKLSTCSYCFFLISARVIKNLMGSGELLDTFLEIFNYQFGHSDYEL